MLFVGRVKELGRYPVKSMQGERPSRFFVDLKGVVGDRAQAVLSLEDQRPLSGKRVLRLLEYKAFYSFPPTDGEGTSLPTVNVGCPDGSLFQWEDPAFLSYLSQDLGLSVALVKRPFQLYDSAPLLITSSATQRWLEGYLGFSVDIHRFRPNLLVELHEEKPFEEERWLGRRLQVGQVVLQVTQRCRRCVMTIVDPKTYERAPSLLQFLQQQHEGYFGVYAKVLKPGWVSIEDAVVLEDQ